MVVESIFEIKKDYSILSGSNNHRNIILIALGVDISVIVERPFALKSRDIASPLIDIKDSGGVRGDDWMNYVSIDSASLVELWLVLFDRSAFEVLV